MYDLNHSLWRYGDKGFKYGLVIVEDSSEK